MRSRQVFSPALSDIITAFILIWIMKPTCLPFIPFRFTLQGGKWNAVCFYPKSSFSLLSYKLSYWFKTTVMYKLSFFFCRSFGGQSHGVPVVSINALYATELNPDGNSITLFSISFVLQFCHKAALQNLCLDLES